MSDADSVKVAKIEGEMWLPNVRPKGCILYMGRAAGSTRLDTLFLQDPRLPTKVCRILERSTEFMFNFPYGGMEGNQNVGFENVREPNGSKHILI